MNQILEIIYEHLCNEENDRLVTIEKIKYISICSIKFEEIRKDVIERLNIKLKTGVCSDFLIDQLALHKANLGEKYGDKIDFYNVSEILNLLEKLEDDEVVGRLFTRKILNDYLHIHHNACSGLGSYLVRNVKEYWFSRKGVIHSYRIKEFEEILNQHPNEKLSTFARIMHDKTVFNKELRGEWLI